LFDASPKLNLDHAFAHRELLAIPEPFGMSKFSEVKGEITDAGEKAAGAENDSGTAKSASSDVSIEPTKEEKARDALIWESFQTNEFAAWLAGRLEESAEAFEAILKRPNSATVARMKSLCTQKWLSSLNSADCLCSSRIRNSSQFISQLLSLKPMPHDSGHRLPTRSQRIFRYRFFGLRFPYFENWFSCRKKKCHEELSFNGSLGGG
jgi:hypothetical protein